MHPAVMPNRDTFCGHIRVTPPLNAAEYEYLQAFAESRRHSGRSSDPYDVPHHPRDDGPTSHTDAYNSPPAGQPSLWCPWHPSCDGRCLVLDTEPGVNAAAAWLGYLARHFLIPDAVAHCRADFTDFTFDHQLTGSVARHRADSGELSLIRIAGDEVTTEVVEPGDPIDLWD
jgi:hypothetical protein